MSSAPTNQVQREEKKAGSQPVQKAGTAGSATGLPVQLRSLPFDQQMAMLEPGNRAIQMKGEGGADAVHDAAARGIASGGGALPFANKIQSSFGRHDISNVQAHTGAQANEATSSMGASAYATGNHVVLGSQGQSLHTAAHEAAHVVQQRAGVSLSGGVGQVGDSYEQHADAVADAVVQGKSAEGLLDQMAGGSSGSVGTGQTQRAVQKETPNTNADGNYEDHGKQGTGGVGISDVDGANTPSGGISVGASSENGGQFEAGREWVIWDKTVPPIGTPIPGLFVTVVPELKAKVSGAVQGLDSGPSQRQYAASVTGSVSVGVECGAPPAASVYLRGTPEVKGELQATFDSQGLSNASGIISIDLLATVGAQVGDGFVDFSYVLGQANVGRFIGFNYTRGQGVSDAWSFQLGQDMIDAFEWAVAMKDRAQQMYDQGAKKINEAATAISDAWNWVWS